MAMAPGRGLSQMREACWTLGTWAGRSLVGLSQPGGGYGGRVARKESLRPGEGSGRDFIFRMGRLEKQHARK